MSLVVATVVEGLIDEAVVVRLLQEAKLTPGTIYGRRGKNHIRDHIKGYNNAARTVPWFVLVDLDAEANCAPTVVASWLPNPAPNMMFRVAVREVEAWLLSDTEHLAQYLQVSPDVIPHKPEELQDPKQVIVNLARGSASRDIREGVVPSPKSGRVVGPAYDSTMAEFVRGYWVPGKAAENSDSLRRARGCLKGLRGR